MNVGLLGGTGDIGRGLALRLAATRHTVVIGSRDPGRGREAADEVTDAAGAEVTGAANTEVARNADTVVICVPYKHAAETVEEVASALREETSVLTPVVPMERDSYFRYTPPEEGSAAREIRGVAPDPNPVAGAFHNVSSARLTDRDDDLGMDILVFGEEEAKQDATELVASIEGLRAVDAGGLGVAPMVESITPLLINVGAHNKIDHPGLRFV